MKKNRANALISAIFVLCLPCASFEYPQPFTSAGDLAFSFGQSLEETFSPGIVFAQPDIVNAADRGTVLITISEPESPFAFASTLGNAAIVAHEDRMITVYGNLQENHIEQVGAVEQGQLVGASGSSAWQKKTSGVIFQTCDTRNKNGFNPFILLRRPEKTANAPLRALTLVNRSGSVHDLTQTRTVRPGSYMLYREQPQLDAVPYKITVLVNGVEAESADYNLIRQNDNLLEAAGRHGFAYAAAYPGEQRQLLASLTLSKGRTIIAVSVTDISGNIRSVSYTLEVQ